MYICRVGMSIEFVKVSTKSPATVTAAATERQYLCIMEMNGSVFVQGDIDAAALSSLSYRRGCVGVLEILP